MKNKIVHILFVLTFVFGQLFAQTISDAPLSKDFVRYISEKKELKQSTDGKYLNEIPSPVEFHFNTPKLHLKSLPEKYDMRTEGLITPVKNQGGCGGCWNFVVMGAIESNWLIKGLGAYDLSEQNMRTCHEYAMGDAGSCSGGNHLIAAAYLTRRQGPGNETDDGYNTDSLASCKSNITPVAFVDGAQFLPGDISLIKQTIIDSGGVYTNMYWNDGSYSIISKNYYYSGDATVNHAVLLIGWDDNRITAGGKGAWIAKNSWGTSWGELGYFYISYADTKVLSSNAIFHTRTDYDSLATLYMYDRLGVISNAGYGNETAYGLIKLKATGKQIINKLGTYIVSSDSEVSFEIYSAMDNGKPVNLIGSAGPFTCDFPGYYSFSLNKPVLVNQDETFFVKAKYVTPGYEYPAPVEKKINDYCYPEIESGVCWMSENGQKWSALGNTVTDGQKDLCIRAYAIPDTIQPVVSNSEVNLNPNPANGFINLEFNNIISDNIQITVYSLTGEKVYFSTFTSRGAHFIERINLLALSKGVYVAKISAAGFSDTKKFVLF